MKSIKEFINEKQTIGYENPKKKEVKCPLITDEIHNGLIVGIDLSQLEDDTISAIYQDKGVYWSLLDIKQLKSLYDILSPDLEFDEWLKENNNFKD